MKSLIRILVCFGVLALAMPGTVSAADLETSPALQLRASVQVDSAGILLNQLVEGETGLVQPLRLAAAPAPGRSLELSRAKICELARKFAPELNLTNWSGAEKVTISRRLRQFEEPEFKELLTATLQREKVRDRGELELRLLRPWAAIALPDEALTMNIVEIPTMGVTPNFIVRFELRTETETIGTWQIPIQAHVWRDVWVARSNQPRGRELPDLDLTTERRDLLTLRDAVTALNLNDTTLELAENLPAGAPLLTRSLRMRSVIQRGRLIEAVVQQGALMITLKVEALEDGVPGQNIRVRNANSRREFRGKVENEQTVTVKL